MLEETNTVPGTRILGSLGLGTFSEVLTKNLTKNITKVLPGNADPPIPTTAPPLIARKSMQLTLGYNIHVGGCT